jgi:hypothetical protein
VQPGACELLDSALHVIDRAEPRMSALQLARRHASDQRWAELLAEEQLARDQELAEAEALLLPFRRFREDREELAQRELDWERQQDEWAEGDREHDREQVVLRAPTESLNSTQKSTQDHFYAESLFFPYENYAQSRWPEYIPVPDLRSRGGCARASVWRPTVDMRHPHPEKREPAVVGRA